MARTRLSRALALAALLLLGGTGASPAVLAQVGSAGGQRATGSCPDRVVAKQHLDPSRVFLEGVAAISPTDVWAVGVIGTTSAGASGTTMALIEHYDGKTWCAMDTHDRGDDGLGGGANLHAVTAVSARDVWAAGTVIEHWDGRAWTVIPPSPSEGWLTSLSASSADNVWASNGGFVERWDGRHWREVPLPIAEEVFPGTIATISPSDAWLGGLGRHYGLIPQAQHWDGQHWQAMQLPRTPAPASYSTGLRATCTVPDPMDPDLPAIAALGPNDVWAVGYQTSEDGSMICPLAWHWDGRRWHEVWLVTGGQDLGLLERTDDTGNPGDGWGLQLMAATPSGQLWALNDPELFALHFDGHGWHVVTAFTGPKNAEGFDLTAISASSDDDVWAVTNEAPSPWNAYHWDGKTWRGVSAIPAG